MSGPFEVTIAGSRMIGSGASAELLDRIRLIWQSAQSIAARSVNSAHVCANWLIGRQIVEAEQGGAQRAEYGQEVLKSLSTALTADYGSGFSLTALKYMRTFYVAYPELVAIGHAARDQLSAPASNEIGHALRDLFIVPMGGGWKPGQLHADLSWTHYRTLIKVEQRHVRDFYEIESVKNSWSARQLDRQISSLLFERLLKSRDKDGVIELSNQGLEPSKAADLIKDPYVLEFLDLPESHRLVESKVEEALISRLQEFLLELGSGFAFVGRQVRLTLDGDHFYPDLVFYHVKLKCYVVIDLKVAALSHGDLGQMQMYVHYYDREVAAVDDNPTIGLILCTDKNDAMVQYVLDDKSRQIFASRYKFQLPSEEDLKSEIRRELRELAKK
jgi:predicted nuclease of restriction endonuclease-like (RecB) superfamily